MPSVAAVVICSIISLECVFILIGNIFTIYVFSTHRKRLKRTSSLLINLAVVDLLVGLTEPVAIGTMTIPRHFEEDGSAMISTQDNISSVLPTMFSCLSLFSLALISVERAYAVILPLRHRVTSNKWYMCSLFIVWAAGMFVCVAFLLHQAELLSYFSCQVIVCSMIFVSLIIICGSYLSIRKKLHSRCPSIQRHTRNDEEQNIKLSRTLFIVIAASFVCWLPGTVLYFIYVTGKYILPMSVLYSGTLFNIASSFVNPVIYSFRMPIFKEPLRKLWPKRMARNPRGNLEPRVCCNNNPPVPLVRLNLKEMPKS